MPAGLMFFLVILIISRVLPSAWFDMVDAILGSNDALQGFQYYMEEGMQEQGRMSFDVICDFIWIYVLLSCANNNQLTSKEYLIVYAALARMMFSFLPSLGLSARIYYFLDYLFFAGIITAIPKIANKELKLLTIVSLIYVFVKHFLVFYSSAYFAEHWLHYHSIFQ